jgi:hypothetical protein
MDRILAECSRAVYRRGDFIAVHLLDAPKTFLVRCQFSPIELVAEPVVVVTVTVAAPGAAEKAI